ncbi:Carcinine transporter [Nymphon striatum]|nr:Carcinine transporter [Nymphon striatum]
MYYLRFQKILNYDDLVEHKIGQFGKAQATFIFLICLPAAIPAPMAYFAQMFLTATPDHWCYVPELADVNLTIEQIRSLTIPHQDSTHSQCKMYDVNFTSYLNQSEGNLTADPTWKTTSCKNGWMYDRSMYESTIITDWNLVCDKAIYPVIANSMSNFGVVIGGILYAWISDKYGRKFGILVPVLVLISSGIISAFCPEIFSWMVLRTIQLSSLSLFLTNYVYSKFVVLKLLVRNIDLQQAILMAVAFSSCIMMVGGLAYWIKEWKYLSLAICVPSVVALPLIWFLPESPRWLLNKGRLDHLRIVLKKFAKLNNKEPFNFDLTKLKADGNGSESNAGIKDLFKTPNIRKKVLVLIYINIIAAFIYFGSSLFAPALGSNPFVSVCLAGAAEIPGDIIGFFIMDRWGRRWTIFTTFVFAGIFSILVLESKTDIISCVMHYDYEFQPKFQNSKIP